MSMGSSSQSSWECDVEALGREVPRSRSASTCECVHIVNVATGWLLLVAPAKLNMVVSGPEGQLMYCAPMPCDLYKATLRFPH